MQIDEWDSASETVNFNLEIDLPAFTRLVSRDAAVLDFGCGYGRHSERIYSEGYRNITGIDSSSKLIKRGQAKYPRLTLLHNKNNRMEFPDSYYDAIIICAVLTCIPDYNDKEKVIAEIFRVLKPHGIIHIVEFCSKTESFFKSGFGVEMNYQTPETFKSLIGGFDEISFRVVKTTTISGAKAEAINYFGKKR